MQLRKSSKSQNENKHRMEKDLLTLKLKHEKLFPLPLLFCRRTELSWARLFLTHPLNEWLYSMRCAFTCQGSGLKSITEYQHSFILYSCKQIFNIWNISDSYRNIVKIIILWFVFTSSAICLHATAMSVGSGTWL